MHTDLSNPAFILSPGRHQPPTSSDAPHQSHRLISRHHPPQEISSHLKEGPPSSYFAYNSNTVCFQSLIQSPQNPKEIFFSPPVQVAPPSMRVSHQRQLSFNEEHLKDLPVY